MDNDAKMISFREMGIEDSQDSTIDSTKFRDLERCLTALLEEAPESNSCFSFNSLLEEKCNYFFKLSANIKNIKSNFRELCDSISENIEGVMQELTCTIEMRKKELMTQLNTIACEKIARWDHQLRTCEEAILELQCSNSCNNEQHFNYFKPIDFLDAGDITFQTENYSTILKVLKSLGRVTYQNESTLNISNLITSKSIAPKFIFGCNGDRPGEFCRPWGVCTDVTGRILVCDRSNHRIQIFNECGEFLVQFGKEGSSPGEFNRPSGIEVNNKHRIIVADKDNHRIQVFTYCGIFLYKFGKQGNRPGQFMYPWDVAVNSQRDIAISDSKNHRVQLFDERGVLLTIFDAKKANISSYRFQQKILDSPRGLAFQPNGTLLITDFNNHRILVLNENFKNYSTFGNEGIGPGQFFRPQGIACDSSGNVVVADSKNYRIQIFNPEGKLLKSFGNQGNEPGQFDCPQGICYHPNQNIIVVDFNNSRVQVF